MAVAVLYFIVITFIVTITLLLQLARALARRYAGLEPLLGDVPVFEESERGLSESSRPSYCPYWSYFYHDTI